MQGVNLISKGQHTNLGGEVETLLQEGEACASLHHQPKLAGTIRGEADAKPMS